MHPPPRLAWYGDDFTGATDTLATAAQAGLRSLLFLGLPDEHQLARAGALDALGIAGAARSMAPAEMEAELEPVGRLFARLQVPVLHYKTCSTFDSAPQTGSIGHAIAVLRRHVANRFVPLVGGQPSLGRYCVFGNLFASAGAGGEVYRIDRHPTMSCHPVTPMHEADLRRHLALQGLQPVALFDGRAYEAPEGAQEEALDDLLAHQPEAVLFDIAHPSQLRHVGRMVWQRAQRAPLLAAGPSSVVQALAAHWDPPPAPAAGWPAFEGPVFVLAGSLSPVTARQVAAAASYDKRLVDVALLVQPDGAALGKYADGIVAALGAGRHVMAVTAGQAPGGVSPREVALACGRLLARVLERAAPARVGIAGGDTSSLGVQALAAWGLSYLAALAPGVALCRLHSERPALDGMQIMLKGGQMGPPDLFERLLDRSVRAA